MAEPGTRLIGSGYPHRAPGLDHRREAEAGVHPGVTCSPVSRV
jgi:hypothetical protein